MPITQQMPNALPGRRYGSFARPRFFPKLFILEAARTMVLRLPAARTLLFTLVADGTRTFRLGV